MSLKRNISNAVPIVDKEKNVEDKKKSSEESKKKIKFDENVDPLEYFSRFLDIPEMILNHLSGEDLIKISEVNPSYYNFIASSKDLMKKIKIVFHEDRRLDSKDSDLLSNSSRLYQNIEIQRCSNAERFKIENREFELFITNLELDFFLKKTREWKNISFFVSNTSFRTKLDLWKLLSSIESSVESISIINFSGTTFSFDEDDSSNIEAFEALKFPKLKELKMYLDNYSELSATFVTFLSSSVSIKTLELEGWFVQKNILRKMLKNLDKVTSLKLGSNQVTQIFGSQSWKRFQFKLKSLTMISPLSYSLRETIIARSFLKFLKSQSDYLEELTIKLCYDKKIFNAIMKLPKLKSLCFDEFWGLSENEIPNAVSTSITELSFNCSVKDVDMKFLLKSMPNVKIKA